MFTIIMIMTYKLKLSIFDLLQVSILITYMFTIIMITTYRLKLSIFSNFWPSKGQHAHYIHVQLHHDHNIPILSSIAEIHTNGTSAQALFRDFETQTAVVKNWEGFMKKRYDVKDCTWDVDYFHVLTFWKNHNKQLTFLAKMWFSHHIDYINHEHHKIHIHINMFTINMLIIQFILGSPSNDCIEQKYTFINDEYHRMGLLWTLFILINLIIYHQGIIVK